MTDGASPQTPYATQEEMKSILDSIDEQLRTGALYSTILFKPYENVETFRATLELPCQDCKLTLTFDRVYEAPRSSTSDRGQGKSVIYQCRNCKKYKQRYFYNWAPRGFEKVGQTPAMPERVDSQLSNALRDSKEFYKKAIRARNFGFGIGALAYLRRIVEDTTDSLMELLKEDRWEQWSEAERSEFDTAMSTYQFSRKMSYAASKILPGNLFVGGSDSFSRMHDVTSYGLHGRTEQECIEIFDRCNVIFAQSFRVLYQHKVEREEFAAQLAKLQR
jgi:hypothetical protein